MQVHVNLTTDERLALRRFMSEMGISDTEQAVHTLIREALISAGYLELIPALEEDTETMGEA